MMELRVVQINNTHMKVYAEPSICYELSDYFTFVVPGSRFYPAVKAKKWDGKIRLFNLMTKRLYLGLLGEVQKFCDSRGYSLDTTDINWPYSDVPLSDVSAFMKALKLASNGNLLESRDYQESAVHHAITNGRCLMLSPTASGKSLILYSLIRWHRLKKRRQLLIVPNTSLVEQMYSDFMDYSTINGWDVEANCARMYAKYGKTNDSAVVISTWQSLQNQPPEYFSVFDVVYVDEAHGAKSKEMSNILENCVNAKYRIGVTGTLDGMKTNEKTIVGLIGPVFKVTTTKELMNAGTVANLKIKCINIEYPPEIRKIIKKPKEKSIRYHDEVDFLIQYEPRNKFIAKLTSAMKGNTLVLFRYVDKQGKPLYDLIKSYAKDKKVYYISGEVDTLDREEIRKIVDTETDSIIVASYQTLSTGTNIKNLNNVVFAAPSKSRITVLQSIGRGLRKSETKTKCTLYDLSDMFGTPSKPNHTMLHFMQRVEYYNQEQLDYDIKKVFLK